MRDIRITGHELMTLKEADYKSMLSVACLMELLVEKGILSEDEIAAKAREISTFAFSS
ncbi:hypothetical protein [Gehongia tenuis]|uniref:Uncharacterized protein n=1 Tax=Gehongia tenuis TaxID=2763655 RepID=A0A926D685_9FIRM|nr:hypothetical protein [Gehongia tenuis]MBC8532149.1 hypothetical protein [Gehongia tenuis]